MSDQQAANIGHNEPPVVGNDIDALRDHCRAYLDALRPSLQVRMARSKLDEFIYWLRAYRAREDREAAER